MRKRNCVNVYRPRSSSSPLSHKLLVKVRPFARRAVGLQDSVSSALDAIEYFVRGLGPHERFAALMFIHEA